MSTSGDTMSTSGIYHDYIGGCSIHRGYHEYIGGCSIHRVFNRNWKAFINFLPHMHHDIPPMYSWYPPDVLNIPRCTHGTHASWYPPTSPNIPQYPPHPLMYSWYPPHASWYHRCTERPRCTHDIPPMYSWYPPDVLMVSPRCTEHPLMCWIHIIQGGYLFSQRASFPHNYPLSLPVQISTNLPRLLVSLFYSYSQRASFPLNCRLSLVVQISTDLAYHSSIGSLVSFCYLTVVRLY